jgi:hypothetical protein
VGTKSLALQTGNKWGVRVASKLASPKGRTRSNQFRRQEGATTGAKRCKILPRVSLRTLAARFPNRAQALKAGQKNWRQVAYS